MMGVSIKYTGSDGREYPDAGSMIRSGIDRVLENAFARGEKAACASACPVHSQRAKVHRQKTRGGVEFKVTACCEEHAKNSREALHRGIGT
jgi:hypothetical protein